MIFNHLQGQKNSLVLFQMGQINESRENQILMPAHYRYREINSKITVLGIFIYILNMLFYSYSTGEHNNLKAQKRTVYKKWLGEYNVEALETGKEI